MLVTNKITGAKTCPSADGCGVGGLKKQTKINYVILEQLLILIILQIHKSNCLSNEAISYNKKTKNY